MGKITYTNWVKTPYAKSKASTPDRDIEKLLEKYKAHDWQWTNGRGANGRRGVMLRFMLNGRVYRMNLETLDAQADERELVLQVKRGLFWMLKTLLEATEVFFSVEEALFSFLELPDSGGHTTYQIAEPSIKGLDAKGFLACIAPSNRLSPR